MIKALRHGKLLVGDMIDSDELASNAGNGWILHVSSSTGHEWVHLAGQVFVLVVVTLLTLEILLAVGVLARKA